MGGAQGRRWPTSGTNGCSTSICLRRWVEVERPMANEHYIEIAQQWHDEGLSPERWLALNWWQLMLGGVFTVRYPDPQLDAWMQRVDALIVEHSGESKEFYRTHLTWRERRRIERRKKELLRTGY